MLFRSTFCALFLFLNLTSNTYANDIDQTVITIRGEVLSPPCTVKTKDILVEMGNINNKDLWYRPSRSTNFEIELNCSNASGTSTTLGITFLGTESPYSDLQGALAVEGDNPNFAIRLANSKGELIPLNTETDTVPAEGVSVILPFIAFIEATKIPSLGEARPNIRLGEFNATATFLAEYH